MAARFLSEAWLTELEAVLRRAAPATEAVLGAAPFTMYECFAGAPPRGVSVGFYCTFQLGAVTAFGVAQPQHADVVIKAPFDVGEQMACIVVGDNAAAARQLRELGG